MKDEYDFSATKFRRDKTVVKSSVYRSHALRGNAAGDALRHASLERCRMHSHAERGNDRIMRSLSRRCVNRVFAPEGEILSFAPPKESIQRKGGSIAAQSALLGFVGGR
jgi:hypothetical protein